MLKNIKKKITTAFRFFIASIVMLTALGGCSTQKTANERVYLDFMGAPTVVVINCSADFFWQKNKLEKCFDEIGAELDSLSAKFSAEDENSVVSKFNVLSCGESLSVDDEFAYVFGLARDVYEKTDGCFDPAVKNLVDLWGFSKRYQQTDYEKTQIFDRDRNDDGSFPLPDQEFVDAFLSLADFSSITLSGNVMTKTCPSVSVQGVTFLQEIDLSGIVKGYASQKISEIVASFGYESFYVSVGTSSMFLSENADGEAWTLGITDPNNQSGAAICSIKVKNSYVSTSGTYENCYTLDGVTYHHIISAKTGAPAETDILSATILCDNGAVADALSTAVVAMGSEKALSFLASAGVQYLLITDGGEILSNV